MALLLLDNLLIFLALSTNKRLAVTSLGPKSIVDQYQKIRQGHCGRVSHRHFRLSARAKETLRKVKDTRRTGGSIAHPTTDGWKGVLEINPAPVSVTC